MKHKTFLFLTLAVLGVPLGRCQQRWVPVVSRIRETYQIVNNGPARTAETKEGYFYRTANGSTLVHWISVNGDEARGGRAELFDNSAGEDYEVNMKAKTAIHRVPSKPAGPLSPDYLKGVTVNNSGQDTVDGITCYRVTPTVLYPDGRQERSGEFCESAQYGLTLRSIMDLTSPQDGVTHRTIREMYEVRIGASPDAKLFDLSSLEIYKMEKEPTKP